MLKILLTLASILLLALFSTPYFTGVEAERQFKQFLQTLPSHTLALQQVDYQRGWLSSSAQTVYRLQNLDTLEPQQLVFKHTIEHALPPQFDTVIHSTVIHDATQPSLSQQTSQAQQAQQFRTDFSPMTVHTTVALNGDSQSQINMPTMALHRSADATALQWQNFAGEIHISNQAQQIENQIAVPQLHYGSSAGQLQFQDLHLKANLTQGLLGFLTGQGQLDIEQIDLKSPLLNPTQLNQFRLKWHNEIENELLSIVITFDLNSLFVDGQRYGPGHLQLTLRNFHAPALNALQLELNKAQMADATSQNFLVMGALIQYLPQLLAKQPHISLNEFFFDTPNGRSQGTLLVSVSPDKSMNLFNPIGLINLLEAQLQIQLPETALQNLIAIFLEQPLADAQQSAIVTQQVQTLRNNGWITAQSDTPFYRSEITLEQGVLIVNGQQQPLDL